jgi:hypothetical protein
MLVSNSVRNSALVSLLALGLAACSEGPMSPTGISPDVAPLMSSGSDGNSGRGEDAGLITFTIWPGLPIGQKFGDHVLYIPAHAVCDPATSSYGSAFWDLPCAPLSQPIQVTATWSTRNEQPVISFSPDLRFAPSDDESQWVKLSLKAPKGIDPDLYYAILWYDTAAGLWVDESQTDPSLRARTNQSGNMVTRRLKHFSEYLLDSGLGSYNVTSGLGGDGIDLGGW